MATTTRLQFAEQTIQLPPLDNPRQQIRILQLRHISSASSVRAACELRVASLADSPSYEALSYVWGNPADPETILVNGHPFLITKNLHSALMNLIPSGGEGPHRTLWIDAICINQGSDPDALAERAHQVSLMGDVYSKASTVVAYLGDPYNGLGLATEYLASAAKDPSLQLSLSVLRSAGAEESEVAQSLLMFFSRPWWHRMWTVQEYVLGRDVVFQLGPVTFPASLATRAIRNLSDNNFSDAIPAIFQSRLQGWSDTPWDALHRLWDLAHLSPENGILNTLGSFYDRDATDPRDKIFATMGLFPDVENLVSVNYQASTIEVFQTFTLSWIKWRESLKILSYLYKPQPRPGLPSFVVDWAQPLPRAYQARFRARASFQPYLYAASCSESLPNWKTESPRQVCANGVIFDTISEVLDEPVCQYSSGGADRATRARSLKRLLHVALERGTAYGVLEQIRQAFKRSLCGDATYKREVGNAVRIKEPGDEECVEAWWNTSSSETVPPPEPPGGYTHWINFTVNTTTLLRHFIVSGRGYFGFAAAGCQKGDVIAVMGGGDVPFILRPVKRATADAKNMHSDMVEARPTFEVIGDAYVHGIMDGEVFPMLNRPTNHFDDLVLN